MPGPGSRSTTAQLLPLLGGRATSQLPGASERLGRNPCSPVQPWSLPPPPILTSSSGRLTTPGRLSLYLPSVWLVGSRFSGATTDVMAAAWGVALAGLGRAGKGRVSVDGWGQGIMERLYMQYS